MARANFPRAMTIFSRPVRARDRAPTSPAPTAASWAIRIAKEYHKFSAAHFLIFDDGTAERLHGHNYQVTAELTARATSNGMVLDFARLKALLGDILEQLDERLLIPARHPALTITAGSDETTIRYAQRRYVVPSDEVCLLPIENSSAECLARHIATRLAEQLQSEAGDAPFTQLTVGVEETAGQSAAFSLHAVG